MKKSNEKKLHEEPPEVDYTQLPKRVEEVISKEQYKIEKKVKLTWDGRQFIARIPSEIAKEMGLTEENRLMFRLTKPLPGSGEKPRLEVSLE